MSLEKIFKETSKTTLRDKISYKLLGTTVGNALLKEIPKNEFNNDFLYPLILGAVFALIGTPCSTPILASIMAFASISAKISSAVIMLFLFSIGQGLILILAGFITSKIKTSEKFYQLSEKIMKFSGILLILVSLYIFYKIFGGILVK